MKTLDPKMYELAQVVFGAEVADDVKVVSALITESPRGAGAAAKQPGFRASQWLAAEAAKIQAAAKPIVFDDLAGEPAPEEIATPVVEAATETRTGGQKVFTKTDARIVLGKLGATEEQINGLLKKTGDTQAFVERTRGAAGDPWAKMDITDFIRAVLAGEYPPAKETSIFDFKTEEKVEPEKPPEAPPEPSKDEQIEVARKAVVEAKAALDEAKKMHASASPAMKGVTQKIVDDKLAELKAAKDRLAELTKEEGGDEGEGETLEEIVFEPLPDKGEIPLDRAVSGPVVLTSNAHKLVSNGPAWGTDYGRGHYAVCDNACATRYGAAFLRVHGTRNPNGVWQATADVVKFSHLPPRNDRQPAGANIFSGYGDGEEMPNQAHVMDIEVTDEGAWFTIVGKRKVGGGSLAGDTGKEKRPEEKKSGSLGG